MKMAPKLVRSRSLTKIFASFVPFCGKRLVLTALISWLFSVGGVASANTDSIPASIRSVMNKRAQIAAQRGG